MKTTAYPFWLLLLSVLASTLSAQTLLPDVAITPQGQHVVINLPSQRLFFYKDGKINAIYPIAIGKTRTRTPPGEYDIKYVTRNPTWTVPKSIQKEMAAAGKKVLTSVPPGPSNPLGPVFIRFGEPRLGLGIHGTNAPSSVPGVRSHGCVRMKSADALKVAKIIEKQTPVSIIYQMVSLNTDEANQLWLAAFQDPYHTKNLDKKLLFQAIATWAAAKNMPINYPRIEQMLKARSGKPLCISCSTNKNNKISGQLTSLAWTIGETSHPKIEQQEVAPAEDKPVHAETLLNTEIEPY